MPPSSSLPLGHHSHGLQPRAASHHLGRFSLCLGFCFFKSHVSLSALYLLVFCMCRPSTYLYSLCAGPLLTCTLSVQALCCSLPNIHSLYHKKKNSLHILAMYLTSHFNSSMGNPGDMAEHSTTHCNASTATTQQQELVTYECVQLKWLLS